MIDRIDPKDQFQIGDKVVYTPEGIYAEVTGYQWITPVSGPPKIRAYKLDINIAVTKKYIQRVEDSTLITSYPDEDGTGGDTYPRKNSLNLKGWKLWGIESFRTTKPDSLDARTWSRYKDLTSNERYPTIVLWNVNRGGVYTAPSIEQAIDHAKQLDSLLKGNG